MTDLVKIGLALVTVAVVVLLPLFFIEGIPFIKEKIKEKKKRKQRECFHLWRRMDARYWSDGVEYFYMCEHCKSERWMDEEDSVKFENDFMNDYE